MEDLFAVVFLVQAGLEGVGEMVLVEEEDLFETLWGASEYHYTILKPHQIIQLPKLTSNTLIILKPTRFKQFNDLIVGDILLTCGP